MADISFEVEGLQELEQALLDLGAEVGAKALRGALMDAAKPTLEMAKALAPIASKPHIGYKGKEYQPGELRKSIKRRSRVDHFGHAAEVDVGSVGKIAGWYAAFVEFGTAPHYTNRAARRGTARAVSGRRFAKKASERRKHPGSRAQPFIRPAWDATRSQVIDLFTKRLQARIENARKRSARRNRSRSRRGSQ